MPQTWKTRTVNLGESSLPGNSSGGTKILFPSMINCEKAVNLVFYLRSALDVPLTVQLVGSDNDNPGNLGEQYRIGDCFNLPQGNTSPTRISIPVDLLAGNAWHPFLGIQCTTMQRSGTGGTVTLSVSVREALDVSEQGTIPQNYEPTTQPQDAYKVVQPGVNAVPQTPKVPVPPPVRPNPALTFPRYNPLFGGRGF